MFNDKDIINSNSKASSTDYNSIIKNISANSPARYNADTRRLYDASGCSGKLAVFAVRLDTFEKEILDNQDALLLDVRTTVEWEQDGHLENAVLIPHSDLEERSDELPGDKEDLILLYSQSGNRSKEAAQTLLDLGYTNIVELAPGIDGWKGADKPVLYGK